MSSYVPIFIFLMLSVAISLFLLVLSYFVSPKKPSKAKNAAYECGFPAFGHARMPFDVRFYLVAILFIIFDLETAFMLPWAVCLRTIGYKGFFAMLVFLTVLIAGFVYEWRKGALEWE